MVKCVNVAFRMYFEDFVLHLPWKHKSYCLFNVHTYWTDTRDDMSASQNCLNQWHTHHVHSSAAFFLTFSAKVAQKDSAVFKFSPGERCLQIFLMQAQFCHKTLRPRTVNRRNFEWKRATQGTCYKAKHIMPHEFRRMATSFWENRRKALAGSEINSKFKFQI